jgi:hypothetical protein
MIISIFYSFIIFSIILLILTIYILKKYNTYIPISTKINNENSNTGNVSKNEKNRQNKIKNIKNKIQTESDLSFNEMDKLVKELQYQQQRNVKLDKQENEIKDNTKLNNDGTLINNEANMQNKCQAFMTEQNKPKYKNADPNRKLYKGYEWQGRPIEDLGSCNKQCNTCSVISSSLQPALWGTPLDDAEKTEVGSILPKFIYKKLDYNQS